MTLEHCPAPLPSPPPTPHLALDPQYWSGMVPLYLLVDIIRPLLTDLVRCTIDASDATLDSQLTGVYVGLSQHGEGSGQEVLLHTAAAACRPRLGYRGRHGKWSFIKHAWSM